MSKHRPPRYREGSHLKTCDLSGRVDYAENFVKQWNGLIVHKDCYEPRNPQDFTEAVQDNRPVHNARPDSTSNVIADPAVVVTAASVDFSGLYVYVTTNRELDTASSGFSVYADAVAVTVNGYTIIAGGLLLAVDQIYDDAVVTLDYTPGDVSPYIGEALEAFADFPVTNNSAIPAPVVVTGYPLDDDGTAAAAFGISAALTNAPDYLRADYTYASPATGNFAVSLPTIANVFGSQAITVGAGNILACEFEIIAGPAGGVFAVIGMAAAESSGGVFSGNIWTLGVRDGGGFSSEIEGIGIANAPRVAATNGFRVGIVVDGDTGVVSYVTTDGTFGNSSLAFTPGRAITFYNYIQDSGATPAAETCSVRLIPAAANMTLTYPVGAVDVFGDTI